MTLHDYIREMPKVEIHVHFQGATRPETLLKLAQRNNIPLPAQTVEELQNWYTFKDFPHFIQVYDLIVQCFQSVEDIELAMREFIQGQAVQNIRYTEMTYTPNRWMPFDEQLAALNAAREWGDSKLDTKVGIVIDIPRDDADYDTSLMMADWAISGFGNGIVAFGLGGPEVGYPPEDFTDAFERAIAAGMPSVPHAGETVGPVSIWGALNNLKANRLGHGVRCIEDPALVEHLRETQIPLELNPTSNICLKVYDRMENHPLPKLVDAGLYVTINSDDPPMFNTTLTNEYIVVADTFGYDAAMLNQFSLNALRASFLSDEEKRQLDREFHVAFAALNQKYLL